MKKTCIAACLALSLGFCSNAMAKDIDAIDVFAANSLSGIAFADVNSLVKNKMIKDTLAANGVDLHSNDVFAQLKQIGINYEKDIKSIVFGIDSNVHICTVVDFNKSIADAWAKASAIDGSSLSSYKDYAVLSDNDSNSVMLSDTRMLVCDSVFDYKITVDNVAKPKQLKNSDKALYTAYSQTNAKADIRIASKVIDSYREMAGDLKLSDEKDSVSIKDADAASLSLDFKSGIAIDAKILAKSDKVAANAARIFNAKADPVLSDPQLAEMGLGFLKSAVSISSSKKYVIGSIHLNDAQVETIVALLAVLNAK